MIPRLCPEAAGNSAASTESTGGMMTPQGAYPASAAASLRTLLQRKSPRRSAAADKIYDKHFQCRCILLKIAL